MIKGDIVGTIEVGTFAVNVAVFVPIKMLPLYVLQLMWLFLSQPNPYGHMY